jgi:hypothetical protein
MLHLQIPGTLGQDRIRQTATVNRTDIRGLVTT